MPQHDAPVPPHSIDAEESTLGAMMLAPHAVETCSDLLTGQEFYRDSHRLMFEAIVELYSRGSTVDAITVCNELQKTGRLADVGGVDRIHEIANLVPAASNAGHWAGIVRETWLARGLVRAGQTLQRLGYDRPGPIEELVAEADATVLEIAGHLERKRDSVFTGVQLVESFRERLENPEDENDGIQPPFPFLSPLKGGRLYVLGGYQADGKTALSLQFLASACEAGARVGFLSIEMGKTDLTDRLISTFGVPYTQVRTGRILAEFQGQLDRALAQLSGWDFEVIDDEAVDPAQVRRQQRRGKYDLLIIDHLHRIPVRDKRHAREELEDAVRRITNVAREFDIPVLLLSQLSRSNDFKNPFPRPTMADLRGSAMIEAEAAIVWFVWRKRDKQHQPTSEAEFIIAKNRFGPLGWQHLWLHGSQVRFSWGHNQTEGEHSV